MHRAIVMLCFLFVLVKARRTEVSQCVHNSGELPVNTYIEGCTSPPCQFPYLQDAVFNILFKAPYRINRLQTLATIYVNFGVITLPVPYDLAENGETCNFLQWGSCPLWKRQLVQTSVRAPFGTTILVGTSAIVELRIVDDDALPVACLRVPFTITAPIENVE